ncbi:hypothetical protein DM860_017891 [Cuscuta australis]|uniref:Uncharacterized protein n=1 Tax=Cuscuta australis TaxID=267555 RepID=A0A328DS52_9ASTE|nr:hypothetical protein DM860_017891 [Cuscuta australis]
MPQVALPLRRRRGQENHRAGPRRRRDQPEESRCRLRLRREPLEVHGVEGVLRPPAGLPVRDAEVAPADEAAGRRRRSGGEEEEDGDAGAGERRADVDERRRDGSGQLSRWGPRQR